MAKTHVRKLAVLVLCLAASIAPFAAYHSGRAQSQEAVKAAPQPTTEAVTPAAVTGGAHALSATYFSWGNIQREVSSGYQALDAPTKVSCQFASGCTIGVEQQVQVGLVKTSNNGWAICTQVDGNYIDTPGCAWQGYIPPDGFYIVGSFSQQTSVAFGNHTVQTFIYTTYGAQEDTYNIIYRVYQP
ncbi:MAG TPA: hypothetical protein VI455_05125 [Terriglobia bacterium]